jgi:hypothetical protein
MLTLAQKKAMKKYRKKIIGLKNLEKKKKMDINFDNLINID